MPILWAALLCGGCAARSGPLASPGWHFPERYRANQVVHVTMSDRLLDFLASVVREGDSVEVVLFDPAIQAPLLRAAAGPAGVTEQRFVEHLPEGNGSSLASLLRTMNGLRFHASGPRSLTANGDGWSVTLSELNGEPGCGFPSRILLERGPGRPRVEVETTGVDCEADGR
jgi:hypothetical protein